MLRREFVVGIGVISLLEVSGTGTSVIIADQTSAHSSVVQPGLVLPNDVGDDAKKASTKDSKKKSTSESQVCLHLDIWCRPQGLSFRKWNDRFETPIAIFDEAKPLGTHLYSLIGPSEDGHSLKWEFLRYRR
jgi:hypothetical protein